RPATFFSLTDANSIGLGLSLAGTPQVDIDLQQPRYLGGLDLTYRWIPLGASGYHGFIWGTEVLVNSETRPVGGFPVDSDVAEEQRLAGGLGAPLTSPVAARAPYQLTPPPPQQAAAPPAFQRKKPGGLYTYTQYRF